MSKITTYYPYPIERCLRNDTLPLQLPTISTSSGKPKYLGPVLGVVLGLLFIATLLGILLCRQRLRTREGPYSYSKNDKIFDPLGGWGQETGGWIDGKGLLEEGGLTIHVMRTFFSYLIRHISLSLSLYIYWKHRKLIRNRRGQPGGTGLQLE
jgi:hypothetical protein